MTKYEAVFITKSDLPENEKEAVFKQIQETITKNGAEIVNQQVWIPKTHLAFAIKKQKTGLYYLVQFNALSAAIQKLRQAYKLNESVLRFLITRL